MKNKSTLKQIVLFTLFIIVISLSKTIIKDYLLSINIDSYAIHSTVKIVLNTILAIGSFIVAKKLNVLELGGLSNIKPKKLWLAIFPLVYLVLLNGLFIDTIPEHTILSLIVLIIYCLSIGFAEELSLRSVLLPLITKYFGNDRKAQIKAIFISAFIFGILHLIKFDKGLYGEITQVFFATFIGVMFGAVLLVIKRIYPLIIIHALIDFVAKLDSLNAPAKNLVSNPMEIDSAILTVLLTLPCFLYGLFVIKKHIKAQ